jgi:CRISPR/Cas system-associated exonuclease Cas4 (RecB family)
MTNTTEQLLPTGRPHVSYSEVSEWARCSWKHKLKHIDKITLDEPSPYLVFGASLHEACESLLQNRTYDAEKLKAQLTAEWIKYKDHKNFLQWPLIKAINEASSILDEILPFMDATFPNWKLFETAEIKIYEPIASNPEFFFKGFIDFVISVPNASGTTFWILDWKTSSRGWFKDKKSDQILLSQIVLYRHHFTAMQNTDELEAKCGFIVLNRSGKPGKKCELVKVAAGPVTVLRALKMVENAVTSIKRGIAVKNKGDNCKYCEFKETKHCP